VSANRGEEELPEVAAGIERCFGANAVKARRYAELLATDGIDHGHLGPREADRIWRRHLFNSAAIADLLPRDASVVDLGSGAGLPGIPLALARPDLSVTLLEPMSRRIRFLQRCAVDLALPRLSVCRGRAPSPELARAEVIVARAVAPLAALIDLALPTGAPGQLIALKGESVAGEAEAVSGQSGLDVTVRCVDDVLGEATYVAVVTRQAGKATRHTRSARRRVPSAREVR
jgi:16S rRNA (guanine527-N7)-methyltransferase